MFNTKTILAAVTLAAGLAFPVMAQDDHSTPAIEKQNWSFAGIFGTYDENQLQRGFQVFRESCSSCHGARLLAFRNLSEPGGPGWFAWLVRQAHAIVHAVYPIPALDELYVSGGLQRRAELH